MERKNTIPDGQKLFQAILKYMEGKKYNTGGAYSHDFSAILKDGLCQVEQKKEELIGDALIQNISLNIEIPFDVYKSYLNIIEKINKKVIEVGNFLIIQKLKCYIIESSISPILDLVADDNLTTEGSESRTLPDSKKFLEHVIKLADGKFMLKVSGIDTSCLKSAYCEFIELEKSIDIIFYIPIEKYQIYQNNGNGSQAISELEKIAADILPASKGFVINSVKILPIIELATNSLNQLTESIDKTYLANSSSKLRDDASKMAEAYIALYCLENNLRNFIDKRFVEKYGVDYWNIVSSSEMKRNVNKRKKNEIQIKWVTQRGKKDIFYLDFDDLAKLIINQWDCFKNNFSDQHAIDIKIKELYNIRCLVAHNSPHIDDLNLSLLKTYYEQIIAQISE